MTCNAPYCRCAAQEEEHKVNRMLNNDKCLFVREQLYIT